VEYRVYTLPETGKYVTEYGEGLYYYHYLFRKDGRGVSVMRASNMAVTVKVQDTYGLSLSWSGFLDIVRYPLLVMREENNLRLMSGSAVLSMVYDIEKRTGKELTRQEIWKFVIEIEELKIFGELG
jgi:hypothetical protein